MQKILSTGETESLNHSMLGGNCNPYHLPLRAIKAYNRISGEMAVLCIHLSSFEQQASFPQQSTLLQIVEMKIPGEIRTY